MKKTILFILLFVYGCNNTPSFKENTAFVVFKTPSFRYADMGFVYQSDNEAKLQIYANGQNVMSLRLLPDSVCMSRFECMSSRTFNNKILSKFYPQDILMQIVLAKPIFDKKDIKYTQNGFIQEIKKVNSYNIKYKVSKTKVEFIDRLNDITIKIIKDI